MSRIGATDGSTRWINGWGGQIWTANLLLPLSMQYSAKNHHRPSIARLLQNYRAKCNRYEFIVAALQVPSRLNGNKKSSTLINWLCKFAYWNFIKTWSVSSHDDDDDEGGRQGITNWLRILDSIKCCSASWMYSLWCTLLLCHLCWSGAERKGRKEGSPAWCAEGSYYSPTALVTNCIVNWIVTVVFDSVHNSPFPLDRFTEHGSAKSTS